VNHTDEGPFRLLQRIPGASMGEDSGNMILHGDNLEALKALLSYNTGNEN
jgi:adenine-specific DNA-methyltransferase